MNGGACKVAPIPSILGGTDPPGERTVGGGLTF